MNTLAIAAMDLGYGGTKIAFPDPNGNLQLGNTPSFALLTNDTDFKNDGPEKLNLHQVDVDGAKYMVGSDISQLQNYHTTRIANFNFINTGEYMALFKSALINIGADRIKLLVVGLPVNMVKKFAKTLQKKLQGTHRLPENKSVAIDQVQVMAQPIGGMIDYAFSVDSPEDLKDQTTLVIDPGFYTLDWVVAKGLKFFPNLSGNCPGGMHAILQALSTSMINDLDVTQIDRHSLDQGLRKGKFKLYGKPVDMLPHWEAAKSIINDSLTSVVNTIGDASDVDQIVIVGGPATYLCPAIKEIFPKHNVTISDKPVYANVRGFYKAGVRYQESQGS